MSIPAKLTIFVVVIVMWLTSCAPPNAREVEKEISGSEVLRRLEQLCIDLPKPTDFKFVNKQISGNSETVSLSYQYKSSLELPVVSSFYTDELTSLGWKVGRSGRWEKDNYQVSIRMVDFPGADYSVYCAEVMKW